MSQVWFVSLPEKKTMKMNSSQADILCVSDVIQDDSMRIKLIDTRVDAWTAKFYIREKTTNKAAVLLRRSFIWLAVQNVEFRIEEGSPLYHASASEKFSTVVKGCSTIDFVHTAVYHWRDMTNVIQSLQGYHLRGQLCVQTFCMIALKFYRFM